MKIKGKILLLFVKNKRERKRLIAKIWYEENKEYKLDYMKNHYADNEDYRIQTYLNGKRRLQNPEIRAKYNKYMRELMRRRGNVKNPYVK